jgi:DNA-binding response OmpR family regulator
MAEGFRSHESDRGVSRILWLDDQVDVARTLSGLLGRGRLDITFCDSAEPALVRAQAEPFDLVIVDLAVPPGQWGGLWFLERLHDPAMQHVGPLPVLVLSGEGSQVETIRALRLGANDYVTKDSASSELADRVDALLRMARKSKELGPLGTIDTFELIRADESQHLEKKQTARFNVRSGQRDERLEQEVTHAVAALWNSDGGTVLLGVVDRSGQIFGIGADARLCGRGRDSDAFLAWLANSLLKERLPTLAAFVRPRLETVEDHEICRIDIPRGFEPNYVHGRLPVRIGNTTHLLEGRELVEYVQRHFEA